MLLLVGAVKCGLDVAPVSAKRNVARGEWWAVRLEECRPEMLRSELHWLSCRAEAGGVVFSSSQPRLAGRAVSPSASGE